MNRGVPGLAVEAAVVGGLAVAAASALARPRRGRGRRQREVLVLNGGAPPYAVPAQVAPVYVQQGGVYPAYAPPSRCGRRCPGVVVVQQAPVDQRPLGVAFVCLPAEAIEQRGNVHFFGVDVTPEEGGAPWRVMRRYNDFFALLKVLYPLAMKFPGAPFPRKLLFACTGHRLEERRRGLELWLRRAIESPHSAGMWLRPLRDFLEAGRQTLVPAPQVGQPMQAPALPQALAPGPALAPPAQAPVAGRSSQLQAPAAAPPLPPPTSTQDAGAHGQDEEDEADYFEIQVPPGVAPGQLLGVTLPDGRQLALPLPEGLAAGAALELRYSAATGTLTPVK